MRRSYKLASLGLSLFAVALGAWLVQRANRGQELAPLRSDPRSTANEQALQSPAEPHARDAPTPLIRGRAVDLQGAPVTGVGIRLRDGADTLCESDPDGYFEVELSGPGVTLDTSDPAWSAIRWRKVTDENRGELHMLVLSPAVSLSGFVVSLEDGSLPGEVYVAVPEQVHKSLPRALTEGTTRRMYRFPTDSLGHFALQQIPSVWGTTIHGCVDGYAMKEPMPVPGESRHDLRLVLVRPGNEDPPVPYLRGFVIDAASTPVRDAEVQFHDNKVTTDVLGEFVLELGPLEDIPEDADLIAGGPGYQARVERDYGAIVRDQYPIPPPVTLVLPDPALTITGKVVNSKGEAIPAWVEVWDKTNLVRRGRAAYAEDLARSRDVKGFSPDGEFVLTGLSERRYTLIVSFWMPPAGSPPAVKLFHGILAGSSDVVLQVEPGEFFDRVTGVVQDTVGRPLDGINVSLSLEGPCSNGSELRAITEEDGRFELEDIPREYAVLSFTGRTIAPLKLQSETIKTPLNLIVRPQARSTITVLLPEKTSWNVVRFQLLDEQGRAQTLYRQGDELGVGSEEEVIWRGRSERLVTAAGSYTAVFTHGGRTISQTRVQLPPGAITEIAPTPH